jgi:large subunit ribosomal protein L13
MSKIIIDANEAILGRLCSYAAKKALEGNDIVIINSEKAVITGNRTDIIGKYARLSAKGAHSQKGPKYSRVPYKMVKRTIRGMLPDFRWGIGKQALARVMCYEGVPKEFEGKGSIQTKVPAGEKYLGLKELVKTIK